MPTTATTTAENTAEFADLLRVLHRLASADLANGGHDVVSAVFTDARRLRSWVDSIEVQATRLARRLRPAGEAGAAERPHIGHGGRSAAGARAAADRSDVCDQMPLFEQALSGGDVTTDHLDAIARATKGLSSDAREIFHGQQDELLRWARTDSVDMFARRCRDSARAIAAQLDARAEADRLTRQRRNSKVRQWVDQSSGMGHTHIELDPERHAGLMAALDARVASRRNSDDASDMSFMEIQVAALLDVLGGQHLAGLSVAAASTGVAGHDIPTDGAPASGPVLPEVCVIVDWRTLSQGVHAGSVCETVDGIALPAQTAARLCCDADVLPVVLRGASEVLHVGRSRRVATRAQRRALAAVHRGCAHPNCTRRFRICQIHHVVPWEQGGVTDLSNLLPLCTEHHHLVHEGGWRIELADDRTVTWTAPDGVVMHSGCSADRSPPDSNSPPRDDRRCDDGPCDDGRCHDGRCDDGRCHDGWRDDGRSPPE